jgi:large subunit ribosomal protein L24
MRLRSGDTVEVIAGASRGTRAKLLRVDRVAGTAVVEGVARAYKHVRRSQKHPQGGRLSKEMPVDVSNLMLVCTACRKAVRVGARIAADGSKMRYCKKCGAELGQIGRMKASREANRS